jgi:CheY-like chemotaxis protein
LRVLLAEDNPVNQMVAVGFLEKQGYSVEVAASGQEVLDLWTKASSEGRRFDLILMDAQMPGMDGFEATRIIREIEERSGEHTPIIALTAHAMSGDRERCLAAGMDGYSVQAHSRERTFPRNRSCDALKRCNLSARGSPFAEGGCFWTWLGGRGVQPARSCQFGSASAAS